MIVYATVELTSCDTMEVELEADVPCDLIQAEKMNRAAVKKAREITQNRYKKYSVSKFSLSSTTRSLGALVRTIRKQMHITQEDLAQRTRLSRTYISIIEQDGARHVSIHVLRKLSKALRTNIHVLLDAYLAGGGE